MNEGKKFKLTVWHIVSGVMTAAAAVFAVLFFSATKPESAETVETSAQALINDGLPQRAAERYERYLSQQGLPKNARANIHYFAGLLYLEKLGDYERALYHFESARSLLGKSPLDKSLSEQINSALEACGDHTAALLKMDETTVIGSALSDPNAVVMKYTNSGRTFSWTARDFMLWYMAFHSDEDMWYDLSAQQKERLKADFIFEKYWFARASLDGNAHIFNDIYYAARERALAENYFRSANAQDFDAAEAAFAPAMASNVTFYNILP